MKILNLYSGLGGNRFAFGDNEVTAVEKNEKIASVYARNWPKDEIVIGDGHQYLLDHHEKFDFIWSSPPCQSHSRMVKATRHKLRKYPDLKLYEEILFLQNFYRGIWVVENVKPYYKPLIEPTVEIGRHLFWASAYIEKINHKTPDDFINLSNVAGAEKLKKWLGIKYDGQIYYEGNHCPAQVLRNCVHPEIAGHVYGELVINTFK